jgi:antitoxin component YwqK of YwqJK toxin-antitoxin module
MRLIFLLAVAWSCGQAVCLAQLKREIKVTTEFYENGNVRRVTRVKTVISARFELYSMYKKTTAHITEFYENGKIKSKLHKVTKIGNSGRDCYEIMSFAQDFYENGVIKHSEKRKCDRWKTVTKEYDSSGKLVFIRINLA